MQLSSIEPAMRDLKMDHITALSARVLFNMGNKGQKFQNFTFTNNLIGFNWKQITTTGGGAANCVFQPDRQGPAGVLKSCVDSLIFTNNAIINGFGAWPPGNFFPKDVEQVGLAKGNEFRLCKAKGAGCKGPSKYVAAGTDGKDIGADIELIDAATKGVI